ncbi:MAG: hypothetical protein WBM07_00690 [Chitinivibrionales bacterium]
MVSNKMFAAFIGRIAIVSFTAVFAMPGFACASGISIGMPEMVCDSLAQVKGINGGHCFIDGSPWVVRRHDNYQVDFFVSNANGIDKYHGPLNNPLLNHDASIASADCWMEKYAVITEGRTIENVFRISGNGGLPAGVKPGDLLGFVHVERGPKGQSDLCAFYARCSYSISLAYSPAGPDAGLSWHFCGDIVQCKSIFGPANATNEFCYGKERTGFDRHNIAGIPFVVNKTNDSFYVYFNEHNSPTDNSYQVSVARAKISEVLAGALNYKVNKWQKWMGGNVWTDGALAGSGPGAPILARYQSNRGYDSHADAAFCKPLGLYLMTINSDCGALLLYSSIDGIRWENPKILASPDGQCRPGFGQTYSAFVSANPDASEDSYIVGKEFYIFFKQVLNDGESLFRIKIEVSG